MGEPPLDYSKPKPPLFPFPLVAIVVGGAIGLVLGFAVDLIRQEVLLRQNALVGRSEWGILYIIPEAAILGAAVAVVIAYRRRRPH